MIAIARERPCLDNGTMASPPWQRRIERAQELCDQHQFAAQILRFYIRVACFQQDLQLGLRTMAQAAEASIDRELTQTEVSELTSRFESFLSLAEAHGPDQSSKLSRELHARESSFWAELLNAAWGVQARSDAQGILAVAFLQPYAELLRERAPVRPDLRSYGICPVCRRKPCVGVLRTLGEGAARSLVCSFCLNEWEFRRIVCPGCGEEDDKKLAVFTASDFDYIRVECCETCKTYIKTVDLSKNGCADPVVDELASAPLDLWARERGYAKLQQNILGM